MLFCGLQEISFSDLVKFEEALDKLKQPLGTRESPARTCRELAMANPSLQNGMVQPTVLAPLFWHRCSGTTVLAPLFWHHCSATTVLAPRFWHHCSGTTVLALLFWHHCSGTTVLAPLFWHHYSGTTVLAPLFWHHCSGTTVLAPLFWHRCFGTAVLALLFWHHCSGTAVLAPLFWHHCSGTTVLAPLFWHHCSGTTVLAPLFWHHCSGTTVLAPLFWHHCSVFSHCSGLFTLGVAQIKAPLQSKCIRMRASGWRCCLWSKDGLVNFGRSRGSWILVRLVLAKYINYILKKWNVHFTTFYHEVANPLLDRFRKFLVLISSNVSLPEEQRKLQL